MLLFQGLLNRSAVAHTCVLKSKDIRHHQLIVLFSSSVPDIKMHHLILQSALRLKQLAFELVELLLLSAFPELEQTYGNCSSRSTSLASYKKNEGTASIVYTSNTSEPNWSTSSLFKRHIWGHQTHGVMYMLLFPQNG